MSDKVFKKILSNAEEAYVIDPKGYFVRILDLGDHLAKYGDDYKDLEGFTPELAEQYNNRHILIPVSGEELVEIPFAKYGRSLDGYVQLDTGIILPQDIAELLNVEHTPYQVEGDLYDASQCATLQR